MWVPKDFTALEALIGGESRTASGVKTLKANGSNSNPRHVLSFSACPELTHMSRLQPPHGQSGDNAAEGEGEMMMMEIMVWTMIKMVGR